MCEQWCRCGGHIGATGAETVVFGSCRQTFLVRDADRIAVRADSVAGFF